MPIISKTTPSSKASKPVRQQNFTKPPSVLDRIKNIGFDPNEGLSVLVYGQSGSGKTTFAATFPKPILWILCSGGKRPGELRSIDTPEYQDVIQNVTLEASTEMKELLEYQQKEQQYKTVVLDHVTGFQDLILCEILGLDELPAQKSWGMAQQQQYGQCTMQAKEYLRAFLNLKCNRVIIGQERSNKTEGESELIAPNVGAALMPSLAGWLNPACDYIVHTRKRRKEKVTYNTIGSGKQMQKVEVRTPLRGVDYYLLTGGDEVYTTKFRVPKNRTLPHMIKDPDYDKLLGIIKGEYKGKDDE